MLKTTLLATAICFAFVVPASAQQTVKCDEASLIQMRKDIDAMTDQEKKAKSIESWDAADAAFKANNVDDCNARIGDASKNMDLIGENGGDTSNVNQNNTTTGTEAPATSN